MALRQSSELQVIFGAGRRRAGEIKESDIQKDEFELLMPVYSSGLSGSRSARSAACPNWGRCVCERQSDGEWWQSVQYHLHKPWLGDTQLEFLSQLIVFVSRRLFPYIPTYQK